MNKPNSPKRPPVTRETRGGPHEFIILEMPDPWGHLTEEQKKWFAPEIDAPKHVEGSQTPTDPAPKSTESKPFQC